MLRGFVVLPLFAQGQHYVFYLSCTTGEVGQSVTYHVHATLITGAGSSGNEGGIDPSVLVMVMSMLSSCIFVTGWKNSSCDPISV